MSGLYSGVGSAAIVLISVLVMSYLMSILIAIILLATGRRSPVYGKAMMGVTLLLLFPLPLFGALLEHGIKAAVVFCLGVSAMFALSTPSLALAYFVGRPRPRAKGR